MKILAQRPSHISAAAAELLITKTFKRKREREMRTRALSVVYRVDCPVDLQQVRVRIIIMSKLSHLQVGPVKPGMTLPFTLTVFMDRGSC